MVLGGPRGSLDGVDRGAGDRRGQQFREHRLGRSRLTHEHEPPVAAQADNGALDHGVVAIELAADRGTLAAAKKRPDCAGESVQPGGRGSRSTSARVRSSLA